MVDDRPEGLAQLDAFLRLAGRLTPSQVRALAGASRRSSVGRLALSTDPGLLGAVASGSCTSVDVHAHRYVREVSRRTARDLVAYRPLRRRAVARALEQAALVVLLDAGLTFLEQPALRERLGAPWTAAVGADPSWGVRVAVPA